MALSRRTGQRFQSSIWPGFVDVMTGLLLVLMFVLMIFTVAQFLLSEMVSGKDDELSELSQELTDLVGSLGMAQLRNRNLEEELVGVVRELELARGAISSQSEQIASLEGANSDMTARLSALLQQQQATEETLAQTQQERDQALIEIDAQAQTIRTTQDMADALKNRLEEADAELSVLSLELDAAREEAADTLAMLAAARTAQKSLTRDLAAALLARDMTQERLEETQSDRDTLEATLTQERELNAQEQQTLKDVLAQSQLTNQEIEARLAAALAAQVDIEKDLSAAEQRAALLAQTQTALDAERALSTQAQRNVEALNAQVRALRTQLGQLQGLLDEAKAQEAADNVQMQSLGTDLNIALARLASEEQRRRSLEEAERKRLEEEARRLADEKEQLANQAQDLVRYRSEFFGRMRDIVANMDGVQIKGDRFVFSSEVLFDVGSADLSQSGMAEVAKVADLLRRISSEIPPEIDWLIRVDGHTDNTPLSGGGDYADNWELSQARALSVVRYLSQTQGIAPQRLAANGFGEYQPITLEDTPVARAQNRRIELKLTER